MARALKIILIVFGGALGGAVGLSLLIVAAAWMLSSKGTSPAWVKGVWVLLLYVTVPLGAVCGAILAVAVFGEGRS